jgi:formylmethanofuran dehydrogenase subunit C
MTTARFVLRNPPDTRLDFSPLIPERLVGLGRAAIERIELGTKRASRRVGDVFELRMPDPLAADGTIVIEGGSHRFDRVGAGMAEGTLVLDGDAGQYAGRLMSGGRLEIRGNAGDWAGSRLSGGWLEIGGNAGSCLGGPLAGELAGMAGGTLVVRGNAAGRTGDRLRRGLIVVEGAAGPHPASRMIAGTLIVCGRSGALPGYLMGRGTLVLANPGALLPTFLPAGAAALPFHRLLAAAASTASPKAARLVGRALIRFTGDTATLGKGEILIPG